MIDMLFSTKLSLIGLALALGVAGCVGRPQNPVVQPQPSPVSPTPTPTPTVSPVSEGAAVEIIKSNIDTSDWLTYRNEEYGFEVQYPKEWSYKEYHKGEPIGDPTTADLLVEFFHRNDFKFFITLERGIIREKISNNLIMVNGREMRFVENDTRLVALFTLRSYFVEFAAVKPFARDIFNAILLSYN